MLEADPFRKRETDRRRGERRIIADVSAYTVDRRVGENRSGVDRRDATDELPNIAT
jgi:hypothetical protein